MALSDVSLWLRALHILAFAAWMAAMWYLPRLLVYHSGTTPGSETSETFKIMERRLLRVIGTPAMILTLAVGIFLAAQLGAWSQGWLHVKLLLVFGMAACHGILASHVRKFAADERPKTARWYLLFNEVPTLLFVGIVILAVFQPF
jgi:putative membrane protein